MTLQQMKERRGELLSKRKSLASLIETDNRDFTEAEAAEFKAAGEEAGKLKDRIAILEESGAETEEIQSYHRVTSPGTNAAPSSRVEVGQNNLADHPVAGYANPKILEAAKDVRGNREVRQALGAFAADVHSVRANGLSDRLRAWNQAVYAAGDGVAGNIGADGAYLLPSAFASLVDRISLEASVVRPRATRVPMSSLRMSFPVVDDTTHASSTVFGGVQAYFKSEEAQLTSSKPAFASAELNLHKLTAMVYVSGEMLDWSPVSLGSWLPDKLAQALAWKEDDKFISGSGAAGEPTGLLYSASIVSISKETGQAAKTIVVQNLLKMLARLWQASGTGSVVWIANQTCLVQLAQLTLGAGTAAVPIFLPAGNNIQGAIPGTILTHPVVFTEKAATLGTVGDLLLANCSEYIIGDAQGKTRSERDIGLKFDYDQTAFRVITYTGGLCPWRSAFTPKNGDSLTPVLSLATRA